MEKLELYIPKLEDLWFYQQMTSDPETMSYNAGWDVDYAGYHRDTGCIDHPDEVLPDWYDRWIGNEPDCFYAYIKRSLDGAWIGDVCFHYIHNDFAAARNEIAAWETHRKAGFKELGVENGFLHMMITKEDYLEAAQIVPVDTKSQV